MRKKQVALYLEPNDHKKIKAIADIKGVSLNSVYEFHTKSVIQRYEKENGGIEK